MSLDKLTMISNLCTMPIEEGLTEANTTPADLPSIPPIVQ
jgi:hypothetical protein